MTPTRPAPAYIQRHPRGDLIRVPCPRHGRWHTHGYADDPIGEPLDRSSHCHPPYRQKPLPLPFDHTHAPVIVSAPFRRSWVTPLGSITASYVRHIAEGNDPR